MNRKTIWYATVHEMRVLRKLLRTHVFIWVALSLSATYFLIVTFSHMQHGSEIPMLSVISPRYIMSLLSGSFVALFCIGVLLLTFDQFKRDKIVRIHEVMSSKPVNDLELLTGRLLGVSVTISIPMLMFLFSIVTYGIFADIFDLKFGEPVEIWSVGSFVLLDIFPNFLLFGSLAILLSSLLKSRLLALLLTLSCLFALFWFNSRLSLDVSRPLQTVSGNVLFPSELIPKLLTPVIVFNRIALLSMVVGFLCWSSCIAVRTSRSRARDFVLGSLSFCFGLLVISTMMGVQTFEKRRVDKWVEVHDNHFLPDSFPDVQEIRGRIDINPGRSISLNLTIDVSVDANQYSDFILFSLNPGYNISHLLVDGVEVNGHEFQHGLLKIPNQYFSSDLNKLKIVANGRPDKRFAYLDSLETLSQIVGPDVRQLRQLGTENSIFDSKFVVLPPGIKWYPTSGTATNEDAWEQRDRDFYAINIEVSVPTRWLVSGPAKRETLDAEKQAIYRFHQSSPIPEFALVGSKFESASMEVEGVEFEVLYSVAHRGTFEAIAHAEENIRESLQMIIEKVRAYGMNYTYGSYSLVEVPSTLRVFGGGMNMDTVMCPPGMLMIRESTLPTYPNVSQFDKVPKEQSEVTEENWIASQLAGVRRYLRRSMFESSTNYVFYQNLIVQQTSATQEGARALNTLLALLSEALYPASRADFDFQLAVNRNILNLASVNPIQFLMSSLQPRTFSDDIEMLRKTQSIRTAPEVWDSVASFSFLDTVEHTNNTLKLRALRFRAQRIVQLLRDTQGTDKLASILADLTSRFRGKNFLLEEFVAVLSDHGVDLQEIAGDLIQKAELPGFIASNPTNKQIKGTERPTFVSSFVLRNDKPASGPVQLSTAYHNIDGFIYGPSNSVSLPPILVGASQSVRVAIESPNPIQHIWVKPYLSLNRKQFRIDFPISKEFQSQELNTDVDPFIKAIEIVEVEQLGNSSITIDDLDPEFSVIDHSNTSALSSTFTQFSRGLLGTKDVQLDHGLPVYQFSYIGRSAEWSRKSDPSAYGTYRRTFVLSSGSDQLASAKFTTTLPNLGRWKLEYHLPEKYLVEEIQLGGLSSASLLIGHSVGTIHLEIHNGLANISHSLDASNLTKGWHTIGNFDLSNTEVDVLVSNKTDQVFHHVFTDAIRWTPVEEKE